MRAITVVCGPIILLLSVLTVVASETNLITAEIGSDLHLPAPTSLEVWDLYGKNHMGTYHQGFEALNGYAGRLEFRPEPNIIILKKWTRDDGLDFRFSVKSLNGNNQLTTYDVKYKVSVTESAHGVQGNNVENVISSSTCLTVFTIFSLPYVLSAMVIGIFFFYGVYI